MSIQTQHTGIRDTAMKRSRAAWYGIFAATLAFFCACGITQEYTYHPSEAMDESERMMLVQAERMSELGEFDQARALYEEALALRPEFFRARRALQDLDIREYGLDQVESENRTDLEVDRSPTNLILKARVTRDPELALRLLEEALKGDENQVWAHYGIAYLLVRENRAEDYERARTHLERAIALSTSFSEAHRLLLEVLQRLGDDEKSLDQYRFYLKTNPYDMDVRYNFADFLRTRRSDPQGAMKQLDIILGQDPDRIDAYMLKGIVQIDIGDALGAETTFMYLSTLHPDALLNLGLLYRDQLKRPEEALRCFQDYLDYQGPNREAKRFVDERILVPSYIERLRKELR